MLFAPRDCDEYLFWEWYSREKWIQRMRAALGLDVPETEVRCDVPIGWRTATG